MSVVRGFLCVVMAASALAASCSLIVQFHDQPPGACDGGACEDGSVAVDGNAAPGPDGGGFDDGLPTKDGGPRPDAYAPCMGLINGSYCADDGPHAYAGPLTDLLYCFDAGIGRVTPCDGGCLHLPDPFPDACNPCPGVKNGLYCGRDLVGFPAFNADFLIQCQGGDAVQRVACVHGCGSNGVMSACYP